MISKGNNGALGAVWVAQKIPSNHVSGHANQATIRTFPQNDPKNYVYSPDVVTFAQSLNLYPSNAPADPVDFSGALFAN